ncbi:MAG: hypothetical protein IH986_02160 [Planctomycetes bacterium]|nr:hypothetical protein [Planctomycetota bacterium]
MRLPIRFATVSFVLVFTSASTPGQTGFTPLIDFAPGESYQGFDGGLYPNARNVFLGRHLADGLDQAGRIRPLDANGRPAPDGKIVLLTVGMSNTRIESSAFGDRLRSFPDRNPPLVFVNGAQGGQSAARIADPNAPYWTQVDKILAQQGVTPLQVQAVWFKEANARPTEPFPQHAEILRSQFKTIMNIIKSRYPRTAAVYASSRIYAGYATTNLNPEPFAYESGFAVKWLIEDQISGDPLLNYDPRVGPVNAAWMQWGPYMWADGTNPRSDGLIWARSDFRNDGTHPSSQGAAKVAAMLLEFFSSAPTTRLWFLRPELQVLLGDLNGDRRLNGADIDPFFLALVDPGAFARQYPNIDPVQAGDINQDGRFDGGDLEVFFRLLAGF